MNRAVICYYSCHHHNTEKLVKGAAEGLPVDIVDITQTKSKDLSVYALVIFASGIYYGRMHPSMGAFIKNSKLRKGQKALVMSTAGCTFIDFTKGIKSLLLSLGVEVEDTFRCKGLDTYGPFGLIGGICKGHPSGEDIKRAGAWLRENME